MDLNKIKLLYLIVLFLLSGLSVFGQSLSISGKILNQSTQKPVQYASVALFKQDSLLLKGVATDSTGRFHFFNLTPDDYILSVTYMGFEPRKILVQNLSEPARVDVLLNESVLSLGEVFISASSTIKESTKYSLLFSILI